MAKKVSGCSYAADKEIYDKNKKKKLMDSSKTAGMAVELKKAEKKEGYSKKPKVKAQKKGGKKQLEPYGK